MKVDTVWILISYGCIVVGDDVA